MPKFGGKTGVCYFFGPEIAPVSKFVKLVGVGGGMSSRRCQKEFRWGVTGGDCKGNTKIVKADGKFVSGRENVADVACYANPSPGATTTADSWLRWLFTVRRKGGMDGSTMHLIPTSTAEDDAEDDA